MKKQTILSEEKNLSIHKIVLFTTLVLLHMLDAFFSIIFMEVDISNEKKCNYGFLIHRFWGDWGLVDKNRNIGDIGNSVAVHGGMAHVCSKRYHVAYCVFWICGVEWCKLIMRYEIKSSLAVIFLCISFNVFLFFMLTSVNHNIHAYEPELVNKTADKTNEFIRVKVITHNTTEEVNEAYKQYMLERGHREENIITVNGWARWANKPIQYCVIHVVEPFTAYDQVFNTWGHELAHCVYGSFHN